MAIQPICLIAVFVPFTKDPDNIPLLILAGLFIGLISLITQLVNSNQDKGESQGVQGKNI